MSFRRRQNLAKRPIHSIKHIVDLQGGVAVATKEAKVIMIGIDAPVLANVTEVETGAKVNAIFLNVQIVATSEAALPNIYMIVYKNPGNNIAASSIPNANVTGSDDFKRQIFHTEMAMLSDQTATELPVTLFKGVLMIPRVFRAMRILDNISIQLFSPGVSFEYCIQAIYKEFR